MHHNIHQRCPLAPHMYVLTIDALGYSLEASHFSRHILGIRLLDGLVMVNNYFIEDSLLSIKKRRMIPRMLPMLV